MRHILIFILFFSFAACKKADSNRPENMSAAYDPNAPYCNDPEAINYNYDFPGTANNYVCIYPTDPFVGTFHILDTVFTADYADYYVIDDTILVNAIDKTKMAITGLCGTYDSLRLTAGRYYKANLDTTIGLGQPLCTPKDTLNGQVEVDSLGNLKIRFNMFSETQGQRFHMGKATKIQ